MAEGVTHVLFLHFDLFFDFHRFLSRSTWYWTIVTRPFSILIVILFILVFVFIPVILSIFIAAAFLLPFRWDNNVTLLQANVPVHLIQLKPIEIIERILF